MQSDMLVNAAAVSLLRESQNRVKSMALIHQILYESSDFANVDFSSVLRALVSNLQYSYALDASRIQVRIDTDLVFLPIDISIPLGLIVNELCSNAMKYAFGEQDSGTIEISLKYTEPHALQVHIADNGAGIPDAFDLENSSTLGLQLVHLLSEQISAELIFQRKNPTSFTLHVPIEAN